LHFKEGMMPEETKKNPAVPTPETKIEEKKAEEIPTPEDKKPEEKPAPTPPPAEIELTEPEIYKLTGAQLAVEKTMLEIQLLSSQLEQMRDQIRKRQEYLPKMAQEQMKIKAEIAARLGVPQLDAYTVDFETRKGMLKPPGQPGGRGPMMLNGPR
jgi:hypothetical protein